MDYLKHGKRRTIGGEELTFIRCDKDGNIIGDVQDVRVIENQITGTWEKAGDLLKKATASANSWNNPGWCSSCNPRRTRTITCRRSRPTSPGRSSHVAGNVATRKTRSPPSSAVTIAIPSL